METARSVPTMRRRLLAWYDRTARDLPWRGQDVYGVWVSETMLQQTRVDVVIPYYQRWMATWPTVHDLASAHPDAVAQQWAGLGYYARARNLHRAAKLVAASGWPDDLDGWRALPGVGPYTAAAVTSIALRRPQACVDGNVARVVARVSGDGGDLRAAATRRRIASLAQQWLAPRRPGDWNQAMMDLGATVCTPRNPLCTKCPISQSCQARLTGQQEMLPRKTAPPRARRERKSFALVQQASKILFVRKPTGLLAGMWLLPGGSSPRTLAKAVQQQTGHAIRVEPARAQAEHAFSHRIWHMRLHPAKIQQRPTGTAPGDGELERRWIARDQLSQEAIPAAMHAILLAAGVAAKPKSKGGSARA